MVIHSRETSARATGARVSGSLTRPITADMSPPLDLAGHTVWMSVVADGTASNTKLELSGPTRNGLDESAVPRVSSRGWNTPIWYVPGGNVSILKLPTESV